MSSPSGRCRSYSRKRAAARLLDLVAVVAGGVEAPADWSNLRSPENYLGFARTEGFASPDAAQLDRPHVNASPTRLMPNQWALVGEWTVTRGLVALQAPNGRLHERFHARDVHLVMGAARQRFPVRFRVSLDGSLRARLTVGTPMPTAMGQ